MIKVPGWLFGAMFGQLIVTDIMLASSDNMYSFVWGIGVTVLAAYTWLNDV